jgi:hypothetical protein
MLRLLVWEIPVMRLADALAQALATNFGRYLGE